MQDALLQMWQSCHRLRDNATDGEKREWLRGL